MLFALLIGILHIPVAHADEPPPREEFESLDAWKPLSFSRIRRHSTYALCSPPGASHALCTKSDRSASGLLWRRSYDVYRNPILRFRWNVAHVYPEADPRRKAGDDYPLRIYVLFPYEPERAGLVEKARYEAARLAHGEYPPGSTLSYVWAGRRIARDPFTSPYADSAKVLALQGGEARLGTWIEQEVDVLADYRRAFGVDPPRTASLAVMNDSDDTGLAAESMLDYVEVRPR